MPESSELASVGPAIPNIDGVLFDKTPMRLIQYPSGKTNTVYKIPEGVESIGELSFSYSHINKVSVPEGVITIEDKVFDSCNLREVAIPDSVRSIGNRAFWFGVRKARIGTGIIHIGDLAFSSVGYDGSVTFTGDAPTNLGHNVFGYAPSGTLEIRFYEGANGFTEPEWQGILSREITRARCSMQGDNVLSFAPCLDGEVYVAEWSTNLTSGAWTAFSGSISTNDQRCSIQLPNEPPFNSGETVLIRVLHQ